MDFASLGIKIDSSQVKAGSSDLDQLAKAGDRAEKSVEDLGNATKKAGSDAASAGKGFDQAASGAAKLGQQTRQAAGAYKLTGMQAQQLSFQLNDLFVQIASGGSPLIALIQQGSQLNGTFGGFGGTLRALGSTLSVARLAIGGLATVIASVGISFAKGAQESADFAKAIALTGNAAGITEGQFNSLAQSISDLTGGTIGSARETLGALVASGQLTGEALAQAAQAAEGLAKVTGQSAADTAKEFARAGKDVTAFAENLNDKYNFLTAAQLQYIRTLQSQGQEQKALEITFRALNERIGQAQQNLGTLERAWNGVKSAASGAINAMLEIGRVKTPEAALGDLRAQLDYLNQNGGTSERKAELQGQIDAQGEVVRLQQRSATIAAEQIQREKAKNDLNKALEQSLTRQEQRAKAIADANRLADRSGATAAQRAKLIAAANEKYKDPKGPKAPRLEGAQLALDLEDIRSAQEKMQNTIANGEKVLEAQRAANLVKESDYWEQKRKFLVDNNAAQETALQQEIARLQQEGGTAKDQLENNRKLIEAQTKLAKVRENAAADLQVLSIREQDALDKIRAKFEAARAAADAYVDTISRQNQRELSGMGLGEFQRGIDQRLGQREDQLISRRQSLQDQLRAGQITKEDFDKYLAIEEQAHERVLAEDARYWDERKRIQGDGIRGAQEALANYIEYTQDAYGRADRIIRDGLDGLASTLTDSIWDGDLDSWKDYGDRIGKQILQGIIEQRVTGQLAQWLQGSLTGDSDFGKIVGSLFGSSGGGVAGAAGGAAAASSATAAAAANTTLATSSTTASLSLVTLSTAATTAAAALAASSASSAAGVFGSAAAVGSSLNFAEGGFTGPGGKYQPAGIVHAGEGVLSQPEVRKIGGERGFNALRRLISRGYADGGYVSPIVAGNLRRDSEANGRRGGGDTTIIQVQAAPGMSYDTALQQGRKLGEGLTVAQQRNG